MYCVALIENYVKIVTRCYKMIALKLGGVLSVSSVVNGIADFIRITIGLIGRRYRKLNAKCVWSFGRERRVRNLRTRVRNVRTSILDHAHDVGVQAYVDQ